MNKTNNEHFWQTKLAARIHDPAEKALVLLRDPAGHEGGTVRALTRLLGLEELTAETIDPDNDGVLSTVLFKNGLPRELYGQIRRADWWASAADRPQWPMQEITTASGKTLKIADSVQVRWTRQPVLIHPLTGDCYALPGGLSDTDLADIKERSFAHFSRLVEKTRQDAAAEDSSRKTLLAFWRFGPELTEASDNGKLGELWRLLPADTRVPDHSIWDHLDLTSAFAGAFAADPSGEPALLALSIGPVQSFIAAARTTSDLWAGSHLLSRLAWEAMRPVCETLGPDAILFPRLRGIPQVDLWLRDEMKLPDELFAECDWKASATDANPLFSAALPNRFVAVVPASQARELAEAVTAAVRNWLQALGEKVVTRLLREADVDPSSTSTPFEQMREQLDGFPEVHWAAVPFSLIRPRDAAKQTDLDPSALSEVMAPFFGVDPGSPCGFLDTPAWQALNQAIDWGDGTTFFAPNPGVLYPAVYDLAERVLAAAKSARSFGQSRQHGWRCSLTGETEWLTTDRQQLTIPAGKRKSRADAGFREGEHEETLWTRIADSKPSWAKRGEHLGALPAIKRLWPTLFAEEVGSVLGGTDDANAASRFVVSTHTMALAYQLDRWLQQEPKVSEELGRLLDKYRPEAVALPRGLLQRHGRKKYALDCAKRLPALLDIASDDALAETDANEIRQVVRRTLSDVPTSGDGSENGRLETYYALLMMDGDRMGAMLSGMGKNDDLGAIAYRDSFHPQVRAGFDERAGKHDLLKRYGSQRRPISPNRHLAISGALNDFSLTVVRHVVEHAEEMNLGRVIYAGGDDVLAMLPVAGLLSTMQRLRHAYSGHDPAHEGGTHHGLTLHKGFAALKSGSRLQLMRMMGQTATASCGAVIAHHQAPLAAVLRELREAEKLAKNYRRPGPDGSSIDRDAFHLTVIKRSGGALHLSAEWGEPLALISDLRDFLADPKVSRRAVYHAQEWLKDLPDPKDSPDMLQTLLAYQLARQADGAIKSRVPDLAARLADLASKQADGALKWLQNFLSVAEFLARETRTGGTA